MPAASSNRLARFWARFWVSASAFTIIGGCAPEMQLATVAVDSCRVLVVQGTARLTLKESTADDNKLFVSTPPSTRSGSSPGVTVEQTVQGRSGVHVLVAEEADVELELVCDEFADVQLLGEVHAEATVTQLSKVAIYGASSLQVKGLNAEQLDLRASGAGRLRVQDVVADKLKVLASGTGLVEISGESARTELELAGTAQVLAADLRSQWVSIQGRGNSRAEVNATAHLAGELSGQSRVRYRGHPDLHITALEDAQLSSE